MTDAAPDRSRAWLLAGRLLIVIFFGWVAVAAITGVHLLVLMLVSVAVGMTGGVLLSPEWSWWGPEPARIMSDPVRKAAYRRSELPFLVLVFVVCAIVLPIAHGFLSTLLAP
jgi:hypothetical protein